jgi:rare lipoprotein A
VLHRLSAWLVLALGLLPCLGCAATAPRSPEGVAGAELGFASYYAASFEGRPTASGERYQPGAMTAAHRTLAFGTRVRVTRLDDGRSVEVRINDRGPFVSGRIVDLSEAAARELGLLREGTARVRVDVIGR